MLCNNVDGRRCLYFELGLPVVVAECPAKKTKSIVVCSGYHPKDCPLTCFEDTLKPNYLQALDLNKPIVIFGDFNCDMSKATSSKYKALSKFISEMNLLQLIKSPTRITLLDIILLSSSSIVSKQRSP